MKKILVANWKLNPVSAEDAVRLARAIDRKGVTICPPFPYLPFVGRALRRAILGAQDAFWEERGPYTGEVSPEILKSLQVKTVIIGHSERRRWLGETDEMIHKKLVAAHAAGLNVILCVGEPKDVRKRGLAAAKSYVARQLRIDLRGVSRNHLVIAYEPIWAIGTHTPDRPADTVRMALHIKKFARVPVLYGGSVTSKNAKKFLQYKEIDGALVGGASLKATEFKKIINHGYV